VSPYFLLTEIVFDVIIYTYCERANQNMKSFEKYIEQFLSGVAATADVDYSNPASVRKSNKGVELYRKSASHIDKYYPDRLDDFASLMQSELPKVSICCAVSLLDLTEHYTEEQEMRALEIITNTMNKSNNAEKYGWSVWLKIWETKKINNKISVPK